MPPCSGAHHTAPSLSFLQRLFSSAQLEGYKTDKNKLIRKCIKKEGIKTFVQRDMTLTRIFSIGKWCERKCAVKAGTSCLNLAPAALCGTSRHHPCASKGPAFTRSAKPKGKSAWMQARQAWDCRLICISEDKVADCAMADCTGVAERDLEVFAADITQLCSAWLRG